MKNKFKWILNAVTICLCVCAIAISVYAIKYVTLTGTGTIGFKTTGVSATITNVTLSGSTVNHTFESSYVIEADETQEMISSKFADWLALPLEFDANGNDITFSFDIQNTASNDIQYIEMDYSLTFTNSDSSVTKYNAYAIPSENNDYIIAKDEKVNFTLTFKVANNEMSVPDGTKYNLNIFLKDIKPKTLEYDANEDAYYYQDIKYTLDADSETAEVAFYRNEPTNVVIPAVITDGTTDYVVTSIADDGGFFDSPDTYEGCPSLTSLTLPNSITYIGCYSFGADDGIGCPNLTQIYIPISVKSIGECAFANCANLTKVTIASALTDMTSGCIFNSCENLSEVNLPNGMTQLGDYNYDYSTNLTQITLPESLENIDNGVFSGSGLKSITIPSNVTSIENSAFNCTALKTVYIDSAVVASGLEAATSMGCLVQHATNVYVKASLFTNGFTVGAFLYENTTQENITFNGVEYKCFIPKVASDTMGNLLYEYSGSTATVSQVSTTATTGDIVIPSTVTSSDGFEYTVTSVKLRAFYNNTAITSLVIPETVTTIGGSALYGCTNLQSLTTPFIDGYLSKFWGGSSSSSNSTYVPSTLTTVAVTNATSLSNRAFANCSSLTSITILDGITSIEEYTFAWCSSLINVTLPSSVISIGKFAFSDCTSLTEITIPNGVTSIGNGAFSGCTSLTDIELPDTLTMLGNSVFLNCDVLSTVSYNNGKYLKSITGKYIILMDVVSTDVASFTIADSCKIIYDQAFGQCGNLTSVTIPNSVTCIGNSIFISCLSLTSLTIPASVKWISEGALSYSKLTNITVESGNVVYDSRNNCNAVIETATNTLVAGCKNTTIPNNISAIGENAFNGCSGLTSITIPSGVTSIGFSAFVSCSNLTSIIIPSTVTNIGAQAFHNCTSLTNVYFTGTEVQWNAITIGLTNTNLTNATITFNYAG